MKKEKLTNITNKKLNVLFVSIREATYPKNENSIKALQTFANVKILSPQNKTEVGGQDKLAYLIRLIIVYIRYIVELMIHYRHYDLLFVGFFAQPIYPFLKIFWHKKIVVDMLISFYDSLCLDKKLVSPNSTIGKLTLWLDKYTVKNSHLILMDTNEHVHYLEKLTGEQSGKIKRLFVGSRTVTSNHKQTSISTSPIKTNFQAFSIVFVGNFIPLQGTKYIIKAAQVLEQYNVRFTVIGDGQEFEQAQSIHTYLNLTNTYLIGRQPFPIVTKWLNNADLVLGIFGDTDKAKRVIPNKVYEAVMLKRPVLTGESKAINEIFTSGSDIITCPMANTKLLAQKLVWCIKHTKELKTIGLAGQKALKKHASSKKITTTLKNYIQQLD